MTHSYFHSRVLRLHQLLKNHQHHRKLDPPDLLLMSRLYHLQHLLQMSHALLLVNGKLQNSFTESVFAQHSHVYVFSFLDSDDGNSCTTDTCVDNTCKNKIISSCCGNFICEAGESGACIQDCGPKTITTSSLGCVGSCFVPNAVRVNVRATNKITVQALSFNINPNGKTSHDINILAAKGTHQEPGSGGWILAAQRTITFTGKNSLEFQVFSLIFIARTYSLCWVVFTDHFHLHS